MKIVHADSDDMGNPLRGGQPVRTFEVNSRIAQTHQVKVLTATYKNAIKHEVRNNIAYEKLGVTIPYWGLSSHLTYLARLPAAIKRTPHDLVVEEFMPPFGFSDLQKVTSKPVVSIVQWFSFSFWQDRYKLPFENIMRRRAVANPQRHLIVQTNKMGDYFRDLLPQANVVKVPCGINQDAISASETDGDYVLFLGRIETLTKGLDDLFQALARLKEQGVKIPLWIVGFGHDEAALKQLAQRLNIDDCVVFKGRVDGDAKKQVLKNCRFMVMPSRKETFGITALEAMAAQKPVVAYDIDHLNELLQPAWSRLVGLGHVNELASTMEELWRNPQLCRDLGRKGLTEAKNYVWDAVAQKQLAFYQEILKDKNKL